MLSRARQGREANLRTANQICSEAKYSDESGAEMSAGKGGASRAWSCGGREGTRAYDRTRRRARLIRVRQRARMVVRFVRARAAARGTTGSLCGLRGHVDDGHAEIVVVEGLMRRRGGLGTKQAQDEGRHLQGSMKKRHGPDALEVCTVTSAPADCRVPLSHARRSQRSSSSVARSQRSRSAVLPVSVPSEFVK